MRIAIRILSILVLGLSVYGFARNISRPYNEMFYLLLVGPFVVTVIYALIKHSMFRKVLLVIYAVVELLPAGIILGWSAFLGMDLGKMLQLLIVCAPFIYAKIDKAL